MSAAGDFWATLPLGPGVALLQHDANGLAALAKPAGLLSHPNTDRDQGRSLLNAPYSAEKECFEWSEVAECSEVAVDLRATVDAPSTPLDVARRSTSTLWLLNRLDSATSGVILAASSEKLAAAIKEQFRRHEIEKVYAALVFGRPRSTSEVWRDRLVIQKAAGRIRTVKAGGSARPTLPAESRMQLLRSAGGLSLLKLEALTGRSHQLRVQSAARGLPIVGDQTYGDFGRNRAFAARAGTKRLFLHSRSTSFEYEWGGKKFRFAAEAPLPAEFESAVGG